MSLRRTIRALLPAAVAATFALAGTASAATWSDALDFSHASISGLSCASNTVCAASGGEGAFIEDNAPSELADVDYSASGVNGVSCVPGTRFCMYVDEGGQAGFYKDGTFSTPVLATQDPTVSLEAVGCGSTTSCSAFGDNGKVYHWDGSTWGAGLPLGTGGHSLQQTNYHVSCAASNCVAVDGVSGGTGGARYWTTTGSSWSTGAEFDDTGAYLDSLSCTSTTSCIGTDKQGKAWTLAGTTWTGHAVESGPTTPLYSACVGTVCQAISQSNDLFVSSNGSTWTAGSPANLRASTLIGNPAGGMACASVSVCVVGDIGGGVSTYRDSLTAVGKPVLSGTVGAGQTLTVTPASYPQAGAWTSEIWARCSNPDGTACERIKDAGGNDVTSKSYTLTADDATYYIDVRETAGIGLDESDETQSNILAPPAAPGGGSGGGGSSSGGGSTGGSSGGSTGGSTGTTTKTGGSTGTGAGGSTGGGASAKPTVSGAAKVTSSGGVTVPLTCASGTCTGSVTVTSKSVKGTLAKGSYTVTAGKSGSLSLKLNAAAKKILKKKKKLAVTLTITPAGGTPTTTTITLKLKK